MKHITVSPEWQALTQHYTTIASVQLRDLFHADSARGEKFSLTACGLFLDYSKNRVTADTIKLLCQYAHSFNLPLQIEALMRGDKINFTENRAALHTALRDQTANAIMVDGKDIKTDIHHSLEKMRRISNALHGQTLKGFTHKVITDVVNIGIGGSDLGPRFIVDALKPYRRNVRCHFVANIDENDIGDTLALLNPETTLFIISSKSFTTFETLTNAETAKNWFLQYGATSEQLSHHFIAITANADKAHAFGVARENILKMANWVGGRYSLWSVIGLPIAISIGMDNFMELLSGAFTMDQHFKKADLQQNMPVLLALLTVWYVNFFNVRNMAVLAYDHHLNLLRPYLQQLEMESNGKHINRQGDAIHYETCPVIWGEPGTNGQHAFHQLLHQGTQMVPVDFIVPIKSHHPIESHREILVASAFSQAQALMLGKSIIDAKKALIEQGMTATQASMLAPHLSSTGNRPSNMILFERITPHSLGALIALYEHKVFTQSILWDINAFDQWGVEHGKQLAKKILPHLLGENNDETFDSSTQQLINYYCQYKE